MKTLYFLILEFILVINIYSQTEWKWITPNPPNKIIYSSTIADNKAYLWCSYNSVLKLDFATDFFQVLPSYISSEPCGPGDFSSQGIAFADSLNGYITDACNGQFRTTDGGQSWSLLAGSGSNIQLVCFGTNLVGWKLGGGGVYKTTNAGATWNQSNLPIGAWNTGGTFTRMYATNQNQVWLLKKSDYYGTGSGVWYSSNGGNSWTGLNTGLTSNSNNQVSYYDIKMNTSGLGYIVGSIYKTTNNIYEGFILKTTDMGTSWTSTQFPGEKYDAVLLLNNSDVVVFGNVGNTYEYTNVIQRRTSDSGVSWIPSYPISSNSTYIYFDDAIYSTSYNSIYIFSGYKCYKSTDNGVSYQKVANQLDVSVSNITFDSKPIREEIQIGVAWLQWNDSPFLITTDGGYNWEKKSLPQNLGYIWLIGVAEEVIYLITEQAYLYKSTDFGETWHELYLNVYSGLQALNVFSKDEFVLSAYKNLVSSTDGGNSWVLGPKLGNVFLENTSISEPGKIVGVGTYYDSTSEAGCIFNTLDYGLTWHLFDTEDDMMDVQMFELGFGMALGEKNLYKTTNYGETWKKIRSRGGNWEDGFYSFAFIDTSNGVLFSDQGMDITQNGGKTWIKKDYKMPLYNANKVAYNNKGDMFIISEASLIMKYSILSNSPGSKNNSDELFTACYLNQNYPNPFNPVTTIKFDIPNDGIVRLEVFDILGRKITTLVNEHKSAGSYEQVFDASGLASGVYVYKLQAGDFVNSKKMILMK